LENAVTAQVKKKIIKNVNKIYLRIKTIFKDTYSCLENAVTAQVKKKIIKNLNKRYFYKNNP
jgi:phenylpyruvate tautomerase PptA (4-oxalocrotonate tautomerase family)